METPPEVAVNTTAGTGAEMTRFCIITDEVRHVKPLGITGYQVVKARLVAYNPPMPCPGSTSTFVISFGPTSIAKKR